MHQQLHNIENLISNSVLTKHVNDFVTTNALNLYLENYKKTQE
jgi:hypothetical protein